MVNVRDLPRLSNYQEVTLLLSNYQATFLRRSYHFMPTKLISLGMYGRPDFGFLSSSEKVFHTTVSISTYS
ncbi:hypothetical protein FHS90_002357 [Rufibacter quisquiliarum]|uniref:Uncharacterized protein n=1 Tax=Rufibacter quisquiliarum TaxID=1549639 RepID=A0A839GLE3_9BACT|nr:hypothetical protein [Rufibacter quisquiliarum]